MSLAVKFFCAASISVPLLISASGYAQTETPESKGPDCKALGQAQGFREAFEAVPSAGRALSQLIDQFNAAIKSVNAQKSSYRQFRKDGKMAEAKNMAAQLDNTWSKLDSLQRQIVGQTHNGMSAANAWCDAVASMAAMGCASSKAQASCSKSQSQWSKASSAPIMTKTQYATTWRKPDDYKFDPPPSPCPAVEQAGTEPHPGGEVREIRGRAFLVRGMRSYPLKVGMEVKPADIIAVEDAAMVQIYLHEYGLLKITEKTKFEIPKPQASETESGNFAKIGDALKKGLQGPSLEVKCSGGGGARG